MVLRWEHTAVEGEDGYMETHSRIHIYTVVTVRPQFWNSFFVHNPFHHSTFSLIQRFPHLKASSFYPIIHS